MIFDLDDVVRVTGAEVLRWPQGPHIRPIHDLRKAAPKALFFPMFWRTVTGSLFEALAQAGASGVAIYSGQAPPDPDQYPHLGALRLTAPPEGFFALGAEARRRARSLVAGVTGSTGKSTTKEYLAAILAARYRVHATPNSRNFRSDCAALLLDLQGAPDEAAVIEMGFGAPGDIERLAAMAQPFAGVITRITPHHLDATAGSFAALVREKGRLGYHLQPEGFLAVHAEDQGCALLPRSEYSARVLTFGAGPGADVGYEDVRTGERGTSLVLRLFGQRLPCRLRAHGTFQAANAAAAALVGHVLGVPGAEIQERLAQVPPLPRRFEVHRYRSGLTIIDDTFSASTDAMLRGLEAAARLAGSRRFVAVLGAITDLGDQAETHHRAIGEHVCARGAADLVLFGAGTEAVREGALAAGMDPARIHHIADRGALPAGLLPFAGPDTLIYCKAAQDDWIGPAVDAFRAAVAGAGYPPLERAGTE